MNPSPLSAHMKHSSPVGMRHFTSPKIQPPFILQIIWHCQRTVTCSTFSYLFHCPGICQYYTGIPQLREKTVLAALEPDYSPSHMADVPQYKLFVLSLSPSEIDDYDLIYNNLSKC